MATQLELDRAGWEASKPHLEEPEKSSFQAFRKFRIRQRKIDANLRKMKAYGEGVIFNPKTGKVTAMDPDFD